MAFPNFKNLSDLFSKQTASNKAMAGVMSGQNKSDALRQSLIQAQNTVRNSPEELKLAQKAYWLNVGGLSGYQKFKENNAMTEIKPLIKTYVDNFNTAIADLRKENDIVISQNVYTSRMQDIRSNFVSKQNTLEQKVEKTKGAKEVDDRLALFYTDQINFNQGASGYLNKIYWFFIIVFLAAIIYNKQYKNKKTIAIFISLVLIIFVGKTLRRHIYVAKALKYLLEYRSKFLMYLTFSIRIILDKLV